MFAKINIKTKNYFSFEQKIMTWNDITYRQLLDIREAANIEDENERVYAIMEAVFGEDVLNLPLKDFNEQCKEL
jgi:ribosomal protein L12E/L44/L45/RPP1/RPP2